MSSLPASIKKDRIKSKREKVDIIFPFISQWELSVAMESSFDPICPKNVCSLSPTLMMLHIKFDRDWPTGFSDIQVQMCKMFVIQGQVTPKCVV